MFVGLDSPQELVRYKSHFYHSEIGVMFTNLAIKRGPHMVGINDLMEEPTITNT